MGLKYAVNEKFFDSWSPEMAYVLGFLYADGSLEDAPYLRGKYIRVTSTDKDRIVAIRSLLQSAHSIVQIDAHGNYKTKYLLRIGSHVLFDRLNQLGLTPKKSLTMPFPHVPDEFLSDFLRGYFDGDGGVYLDKDTRGRVRRLLSVFTSGSKSFLTDMHEVLIRTTNISGAGLRVHGSNSRAYQLRYSTRDSLRLFLFMYHGNPGKELRLKRKYDIFKEYLRIRGLGVGDIPSVLEHKGPVAKK